MKTKSFKETNIARLSEEIEKFLTSMPRTNFVSLSLSCDEVHHYAIVVYKTV